jgi:putative CocE/NonD family hydrolase
MRLLDGVDIPMRDGVNLATDIWLPETNAPCPVLLQRTPYRRETPFGSQYISSLEFQSALRRGYAIAVQDTRGRYASGGQFRPFEDEANDGADTIEWLRQQSFCDGSIGMFGASYVGATQVLALGKNPNGLKAVVPQLTTARYGETWIHRGGASELAFLLLWVIESLGADHLQRRAEEMSQSASDRLNDLLADLQQDPLAAFSRLPILDEAIIELAPYLTHWFAADADHQHSHLDSEDWLKTNKTAALVIGGWNDIFIEGSIELFLKTRRRWKTPEQVPDRLIIGPWSHGNPTDWQGDEWLGYSASSAELPSETLRFFDQTIKGAPQDSPMVRYFRSGTNTWHCAPDWPLPGSTDVSMYLDCDRASLRSTPGGKAIVSYVSDPSDPVPTIGGANFLPGLLLGQNSGPKNQEGIERRDDVLTFTSMPLREELEITGLVRAVLWVSSSVAKCDWTARLCEVNAEGQSLGVVDGILRWNNPEEFGNKPSEIEVRLGHVSRMIAKGNRLRLQIASSNFPRFDRNPQAAVDPARAKQTDYLIANQSIFSGSAFPSALILPVIPKSFPEGPNLASFTTVREIRQ